MKSWSEIKLTLEKTQDGSPTLRRLEASRPDFLDGQSMHHTGGAWSETLYIYGEVTRQIRQWQIPFPSFLSVGLGLGYNELLIAREMPQPFRLWSFESLPQLSQCFLDWVFERTLSEEIQSTYDLVGHYVSEGSAAQLKEIKVKLQRAYENQAWVLAGALEETAPPAQKFHGIMYDAYSRAVCPQLWDPDFLKQFLKNWADPLCCLSTYSSAGDMKRSLKANNFSLDLRPGFQSKRQCTWAWRGSPIFEGL